jgi:hypothetical protein
MRDRMPYVLLRRGLKAHGYNQDDVAALLERSRQYVSDRMNAKGEWMLGEAYTLLYAIDEPESELHRFFPSDPYKVVEAPKKRTGRLFRVVTAEERSAL